MDNKEKAVVLK